MYHQLIFAICFTLQLVSVLPAQISSRPNVLLICVDDLRPELGCYGADYIHSPHIDSLASAGTLFTHHYVQAPTCGASRCALLTGRYGGPSNTALFQRAALINEGANVPPSLPAWFRQHGYVTVSVGKVSHHPGGRGGPDWDSDAHLEMPNSWDRHLLPAADWRHPRGWMHGLAHGEIRERAQEMDVFQSLPGEDRIYPDGVSSDEALRQLDLLCSDSNQAFFMAYGILRPHLPFGAPAKYMQYYDSVELPTIKHPRRPVGKTTWHASNEFMKYNRWGRDPNQDPAFAEEVRKHYAACVSFADAQVGKIVERLKELGAWQNTIIVLWGDHGWHLGEHAVWGKHTLFEESLHAPLIIYDPQAAPARARAGEIVESIDVFPTLCQLANLPIPDFVQGTPLLSDTGTGPAAESVAVGYFKQARTLRTQTHRLVAHADGYCELYDHTSERAESHNIAATNPELTQRLLDALAHRLPVP